MSFPLPLLPPVLALLMGEVPPTQQPSLWEPGVRHIELTEDEAGQVHEVGISPGLTTAFRFHGAAVNQAESVLAGRERFWMVTAEDAILLVPSNGVRAGERLRLTVPFKDTSAPASATFELVVHAALAERQVEVHRRPRTAASLRSEVKEKDARLQQCRELVTRLQAEQQQPASLTALLASGRMAYRGIAARDLRAVVIQRPVNPLHLSAATSFRANGRVAVELWLDSPGGAAVWMAEGVVLRGVAGEELKGLTMWQDIPIREPPQLRVVLEAEAAEHEARGPFSLKLWDAGGKHTVAFGNVTFP